MGDDTTGALGTSTGPYWPARDIWRLRSVENDAPRADAAGTATTSVPADPLLEAP